MAETPRNAKDPRTDARVRRASYRARVILEHALLPVVPGREAEFEAAMTEAQQIIATMPGFLNISVSRCVERPSTYLLRVEWERLEDHTEGFRRSDAYQEWRRLLHHFYDPFPVVEHFVPVSQGKPRTLQADASRTTTRRRSQSDQQP